MSQLRLGRRGCGQRTGRRTDRGRFFGRKLAVKRPVVLCPFGLSGLDSHPPRVQAQPAASAARGKWPGDGTLMEWVSV
jgi:hypothetical protein